LKPPASPSPKRAWSPLAVSAAVHLLVLLGGAVLSRQTTETEPAERRDGPVEDARRAEMIYLPPPEPEPSPPQELRPRPLAPPIVSQTLPEPEPNAPPEATPSRGADADALPSNPPSAVKAAPMEEATIPVTMESEARRIFGRPRLATRADAGPQATRPMQAWLPDNSERCTPRELAPASSADSTQHGTVVGRIYRQDNGRPLAGAHLQMIGTPYVAFTDGTGEYRFRFDLTLVDNCRTQYVRVTAAGYESRLLVVVVGPSRSEDVRLRRR